MPAKTTKIQASSVKPYEVTIGTPKTPWKLGVISLVDESRLPLGAVVQAKNYMQTQDGVWSTRWGSRDYGQDLIGPITGGIEFVKYNTDGSTTQWTLVIDNGTLKRSRDGGAWTSISGYTYDTTNQACLLQYQNKIFIANGVDNLNWYDIITDSIVVASPLTTPGTVTPSLSSTLSAGTIPLYYQVTAISSIGETMGSAIATANVNIKRDSWYNPNATQTTTSSYYTQLSFAKVANAVGYNIYLSDGVSGVTYYLDSIGQPTGAGPVLYTDYGNAAVNDFVECPTADTTAAPLFRWIALSDNRLWGTGDKTHPNRVYWAGTGAYSEAFNAYLGGGWVDILPGGSQRPQIVKQFRDGKGDPLTTVLMAEPSGYGSTWHIDLQSSQIGNTSIIIPVVVQSLGTFGTLSPFGVIETNQNVYFHSGTGGIYSSGSVPTLFNVLATQEVSINIRPDVKQIGLAALNGLTGIEFDRKLWFSVPYASSNNNRIFIYDLEKENWNPYAFDFGVAQFFRYTDNSGLLHLLAIKSDRSGLIDINPQYQDDNGVPFQTHLQTGLVHVSPDHIQFAHVNYVYFELSHPEGEFTLIFSGTAKNQPLTQLQAITTSGGGTLSNVGFSSYPFSARPFSFDTTSPSVLTEISVKERIRVNKLLNNWAAELITVLSNANLTVNQITVVGQYIPGADPSSWILN